MEQLLHQPVLYHEVINALQPKSQGKYVDGTLGAGGHALGILEASDPDGRLLGLDVDPQAITLARENLAPYGERVRLIQSSYDTLSDILDTVEWDKVDGLLLDLGLSSIQVDSPDRGFSFQKEAPLDMRFDPQQLTSAADLVNGLPQDELADIIYRFGEERASRRIARAILKARPLQTTLQLAAVIQSVSPRKGRLHPATKTFQALRIAVNEELDRVENVLPQAVAALRPGARLAIISFHSLEDRIVKRYFHEESQDCICPPEQPVCTCDHKATLKKISRKPITPGEAEISDNPRARSAKLRIAEKL
ncbi:MAG: 16S rRNA (cytosine(1402)-N(4))-methyltransferase RsmH [Anaerolineae bacterium]|nr:16S rRNA (cytosine(1402)-N(4))-methyltransferase RsmH [Anaerolineae bacterium]MDK1080541.1 16S rRNA (cytosine(1402)-N(4))-methyltransferase RsmH [Anaerolineae bacterium]MDK1117416.1 16S rRNA (cytosine(1402)-N(4))-methyltransferase RsmH [Anaerolineae bacterium]